MNQSENVIGIDVGSISISIAEINIKKDVMKTDYIIHKGNIKKELEEVLAKFNPDKIKEVALTTSTPKVVDHHRCYDNRISLIEAAKFYNRDIQWLLTIGGEKFGLIRFDDDGNYLSSKSNTSCAAGTGSFLDQQAGRLNLEEISQLSLIAETNKDDIPPIASRCSVFAKTDLIHAQQEGYKLAAISDGLCLGLAKNISDTLFSGEKPLSPIFVCGGVSKNRAVLSHLQTLTGLEIRTDDIAHLYEAIGAAHHLINEKKDQTNLKSEKYFFTDKKIQKNNYEKKKKKFFYAPLTLMLSRYPDFSSHESYIYTSDRSQFTCEVEVDLYETFEQGKEYNGYWGIDIGSTSTKGTIVDDDKKVLVGFYTRTAGRPFDAICAIFEACNALSENKSVTFNIKGAGTTGSGRKFIGKIIGADAIFDEITAHARAAIELNPDVDTIIEIGGQDAKFTTVKNGIVTFSSMNTVCAAGTGSFIEEQAKKLGVDISEYSKRAENISAPLSSDRCTVFMERDINHFLNDGYNVNEVLASALHSVRENYLVKVAVEKNIGKTVLFQGATAKNRALVAAFEQRLDLPIWVSKFCHLTGALGSALMLMEEKEHHKTSFRGINIYKKSISIISEVCDLCTNNCKLTIAEIEGEKVAYGFLCGRDYDTKKFINRNISGFDLLKSRKKITKNEFSKLKNEKNSNNITIGLPSALYMFEETSFWKKFFELLSFNTLTSENIKSATQEGKCVSKAEFCTPINSMHGHVKYLYDKVDYIFLPFYLEERQKNNDLRRQYCYYTQFIPSLASGIETGPQDKIIAPVIKYLYTHFYSKIQLYRSLKAIDKNIRFLEIASALEKVMESDEKCKKAFINLYAREMNNTDDISVVFLGRPYTVLNHLENKKIPEIFAALGIKTFFQDMVPVTEKDSKNIAPLLKEIHWKYSAEILEAAEVIANTKRVYPVYITSFKCAPDAFIKDDFKRLMETHKKPYLILELDEHDSNVGYETRIEASVRAFRNDDSLNCKKEKRNISYKNINPQISEFLSNKTIFLPNWDRYTSQLLAANLRHEGYDVIVINERESTIRESLKFNSGQCIPVNAITQGFVETVKAADIDPSKAVLWMSKSTVCSLKMYPHHIKSLLSSYGGGMEKAEVFRGLLTYIDISLMAGAKTYLAYMIGGLLRKTGCRIRPYEKEKGITDKVIDESILYLTKAFEGKYSIKKAVKKITEDLSKIDIVKEKRPKVAIFGDIYVRDNDVMNQGLIRFIEENGGEIITTPYSTLAKMISKQYYRKWFLEGKYYSVVSASAIMTAMTRLSQTYYKYFEPFLDEPLYKFNESPESILSVYNIKIENTGESMENILKIYYMNKYHPDLSLFIQTSPAFCCPSIITEAMSKKIEKKTGIPVVSITYDGTGGNRNDIIIPYLQYPRKQSIREISEKANNIYYSENG